MGSVQNFVRRHLPKWNHGYFAKWCSFNVTHPTTPLNTHLWFTKDEWVFGHLWSSLSSESRHRVSQICFTAKSIFTDNVKDVKRDALWMWKSPSGFQSFTFASDIHTESPHRLKNTDSLPDPSIQRKAPLHPEHTNLRKAKSKTTTADLKQRLDLPSLVLKASLRVGCWAWQTEFQNNNRQALNSNHFYLAGFCLPNQRGTTLSQPPAKPGPTPIKVSRVPVVLTCLWSFNLSAIVSVLFSITIKFGLRPSFTVPQQLQHNPG